MCNCSYYRQLVLSTTFHFHAFQFFFFFANPIINTGNYILRTLQENHIKSVYWEPEYEYFPCNIHVYYNHRSTILKPCNILFRIHKTNLNIQFEEITWLPTWGRSSRPHPWCRSAPPEWPRSWWSWWLSSAPRTWTDGWWSRPWWTLGGTQWSPPPGAPPHGGAGGPSLPAKNEETE